MPRIFGIDWFNDAWYAQYEKENQEVYTPKVFCNSRILFRIRC
jgi:hypothetical protein